MLSLRFNFETNIDIAQIVLRCTFRGLIISLSLKKYNDKKYNEQEKQAIFVQSEDYRKLEVSFSQNTRQAVLIITSPYSPAIALSHKIQSSYNEDRLRLIPDV